MNCHHSVNLPKICRTCWKHGGACQLPGTGHSAGCADHQRLAHWVAAEHGNVDRLDRYNRYYLAIFSALLLLLPAAWLLTSR